MGGVEIIMSDIPEDFPEPIKTVLMDLEQDGYDFSSARAQVLLKRFVDDFNVLLSKVR
jgi:hypothetical protein